MEGSGQNCHGGKMIKDKTKSEGFKWQQEERR